VVARDGPRWPARGRDGLAVRARRPLRAADARRRAPSSSSVTHRSALLW